MYVIRQKPPINQNTSEESFSFERNNAPEVKAEVKAFIATPAKINIVPCQQQRKPGMKMIIKLIKLKIKLPKVMFKFRHMAITAPKAAELVIPRV